jgi:hypothetical protein
MQFGELHKRAKPLRVGAWIDAQGAPRAAPLRLEDLGDGYKILFCFQHGCPGCHARGFPTLRRLRRLLTGRAVGYAAIQTAFEDASTNSIDKLRINQLYYDLEIPFGHDVPAADETYPTFMQDYRSAGTPWFTVIDPRGTVVFADFRLDADRFVAALDADDADLQQRDG